MNYYIIIILLFLIFLYKIIYKHRFIIILIIIETKIKLLFSNISLEKLYEILYLDDIEKTIMKGSAIYGLKN